VASAIANVFPQGSHFLSTAARPATYAVEQWAYWASQVSKRSPIRILLLSCLHGQPGSSVCFSAL
jgi:hypothetical protein